MKQERSGDRAGLAPEARCVNQRVRDAAARRPRTLWRLALLATLPFLAAPAAAGGRLADHVVLISVDGLLPEYVVRPQEFGLRLPNIQALRDQGSWAEGAIGPYPSLTYPSHTSIATGVRPARHGIPQNTRFDPRGAGEWYFESSAIRVPTLWDVVQSAGLKTAGVSWPVTVGSSIDFLFPEVHQNPPDMTWLDLSRRESTPGLIDAVVEELGGFGASDNRDPRKRDTFATAVATHILRRRQPNLLLIHLVQTDYAQHATGKHTVESLHAFSLVDGHIGEIVRASEQAGIRGRTAFVVTGDHGFYRVHSVLQPNVVLRQAGLLKVGADGKLSEWRAIAHRAAIRLEDPADPTLARRVETLFREMAEGPYQHLFRVVGRAELDRLGADPEVLLILEPVEGYAVSESLVGDAFIAPTSTRGTHGFLPTIPAMHTGLVFSGAGVRQGVEVPIARLIDIAPTVARLLGLEMKDIDGSPMVGILNQPAQK
jgi:predicted AlkP superfamily pyrophosphatase or phosphodiesterase